MWKNLKRVFYPKICIESPRAGERTRCAPLLQGPLSSWRPLVSGDRRGRSGPVDVPPGPAWAGGRQHRVLARVHRSEKWFRAGAGDNMTVMIASVHLPTRTAGFSI